MTTAEKGRIAGSIEKVDPELHKLMMCEEERQRRTINLIASENYAHVSVMQASASPLTNKYSEGRPGERYYGGTRWIDEIELLCQRRALELFRLDPEVWGVSVQAYSGSSANFAAYTALIPPGGRIMGLDLPSGGHLTHGYQTKTRKISATSVYFNSRPYTVDSNGFIDYDGLEKTFMEFLPQILICGYSAHSRDIDYERMRSVADRGHAYLLADISHIAPLVASGVMKSPFEYCDVVTTTTQKGLRGPRGALIFYRRSVSKDGVNVNLDARINSAVFPMLQGGPHNHTIAGIAAALKLAKAPEFAEYSRRVVENSRTLCASLQSMGFSVLTGGTDNHMFLVSLKSKSVNGSVVEHMCDALDVSINRNAVAGDSSPLRPSGIRLGTYAVTTRGLGPNEMREVARIINDIINLCRTIAGDEDVSKAEFERRIEDGRWMDSAVVTEIRERVSVLAREFPIPGFPTMHGQ
jgi:glycine hydroxymethyltransferase